MTTTATIQKPKNFNRLPIIAAAYREMPSGGAALNVSKGVVGNGMGVVAQFSSDREAKAALKAAGFIEISYGWKLSALYEIDQGGRWLTVSKHIFVSWTGNRRKNGDKYDGPVEQFLTS